MRTILLIIVIALLAITGCWDGTKANPGDTAGGNNGITSNDEITSNNGVAGIYGDIISVAYILQSAGPGSMEDQIPTRTTIFSNGELWVVRESEELVFYFEEKFTTDASDFEKVISVFEKEGFFDLPDKLSTDSVDGAFIYIEVETNNGRYMKGGLNPNNKKLLNCIDAIKEVASQFDITPYREAVEQYDYEQAYINKYGKIYNSPDEIYSLFMEIYQMSAENSYSVPVAEVDGVLNTAFEYNEYLADEEYEFFHKYFFKYRRGDFISDASMHVFFGDKIGAFHSGITIYSDAEIAKYKNHIGNWQNYNYYEKYLGKGILDFFNKDEYWMSWENERERSIGNDPKDYYVRGLFNSSDDSVISFNQR